MSKEKWDSLLSLPNVRDHERAAIVTGLGRPGLGYADLIGLEDILCRGISHQEFPKRQRARQAEFLAHFVSMGGRLSPRRARAAIKNL